MFYLKIRNILVYNNLKMTHPQISFFVCLIPPVKINKNRSSVILFYFLNISFNYQLLEAVDRWVFSCCELLVCWFCNTKTDLSFSEITDKLKENFSFLATG